jgi:hypothetical protein
VALQTPDGMWRVDVVKQRGAEWFRLACREPHQVWEPLAIATVERMLRERGVDMADLEPVEDAA